MSFHCGFNDTIIAGCVYYNTPCAYQHNQMIFTDSPDSFGNGNYILFPLVHLFRVFFFPLRWTFAFLLQCQTSQILHWFVVCSGLIGTPGDGGVIIFTESPMTQSSSLLKSQLIMNPDQTVHKRWCIQFVLTIFPRLLIHSRTYTLTSFEADSAGPRYRSGRSEYVHISNSRFMMPAPNPERQSGSPNWRIHSKDKLNDLNLYFFCCQKATQKINSWKRPPWLSLLSAIWNTSMSHTDLWSLCWTWAQLNTPTHAPTHVHTHTHHNYLSAW